jgi:hypothetical protein
MQDDYIFLKKKSSGDSISLGTIMECTHSQMEPGRRGERKQEEELACL